MGILMLLVLVMAEWQERGHDCQAEKLERSKFLFAHCEGWVYLLCQ